MLDRIIPGNYPYTHTFAANTAVNLKATPAPGFRFVDWSGAVDSTDETVSLVMDCTKNVTATFTQTSSILTTTPSPDAGGDIRVDPPPNLEQGYIAGTPVTITATAAEGYRFVKWSGSVDSTDETVSLIMDSAKNVTATFTQTGAILVTIPSPDAGGDIRVDPPPNLEQGYIAGTPVTIIATAAKGYRFSHWSGSITSKDNPVTLVMSTAQEVNAHFVANSSFAWWWIIPGVGVVAIALPIYFFVIRKRNSSGR